MNWSSLPTERVHPAAERLDRLPTAALVRLLNREDARAVRAVAKAAPRLAALAEVLAATVRAGGRVYYVGAGTSGRLGALDAAEWSPTFGTPPTLCVALIAGGRPALTRAVENVEASLTGGALAAKNVKAKDVVIGISASGVTAFVRGALNRARARGATTALLTCNPRAREPVDHLVAIDTGPELVAGSTRLKAGTATKLMLNAISTCAMIRLGRIQRGRMIHLRPLNPKLRSRAARIARALGPPRSAEGR